MTPLLLLVLSTSQIKVTIGLQLLLLIMLSSRRYFYLVDNGFGGVRCHCRHGRWTRWSHFWIMMLNPFKFLMWSWYCCRRCRAGGKGHYRDDYDHPAGQYHHHCYCEMSLYHSTFGMWMKTTPSVFFVIKYVLQEFGRPFLVMLLFFRFYALYNTGKSQRIHDSLDCMTMDFTP